MHGMFAIAGVVSFVFLYGAGAFLAFSTMRRADQWFSERRRCLKWPREAQELSRDTLAHDNTACELPKIDRQRRLTPGDEFAAKDILLDAYDRACVTGDIPCKN